MLSLFIVQNHQQQSKGLLAGEMSRCYLSKDVDLEKAISMFRRTREDLLTRLLPGDVVHAHGLASKNSLICLVTQVTDETLQARVVTTQDALTFDRRSGEADWGDHGGRCRIGSVAPLPADVYAIVLAIDRKNRLASSMEGIKSSKEEFATLVTIGNFYEDDPI